MIKKRIAENSSRIQDAQKIIANADEYKICECCCSIVTMSTTLCPNCHSYRFNENSDNVKEQAQFLSSKEQSSITLEDLG